MTNHQNKCFFSLALKALEIKKKFKLYTSEKEYAKAENENAEINKCLCTKLSESFNTVLDTPKNVKNSSFFNKVLVEDSMENFIFKSVFGFLGGVILTYICFMFLIFSLNFTLKRATYICMGLGVILSLGLAFSVKIRCTVFLCMPQLFSKRGRQALLAYAFILALSGPAKNTLHNVEVMSESLACTQEQLKQAENELLKCVQKPNTAAKKSIEKLLEKINFAVKDFKNFILQLYKTCFDILETVLQSQKWLYSISLLCHKKMGRPAQRCLNLLAETQENCDTMISTDHWKELCRIDPLGQEKICSASAKSFCMRSDVPESLPVLKLEKQLDNFKHRAMNIFYVSIEGHQTYSQTNRSYTYHEEYQGMATEIRQKTDQFLQYFDFMSVIFGIFILVLFVKVIIYRHKFLTEDQYDNRYITADFVDIDNTRAAFRMETLLPLAPRERMQYIKVSSVRLVPCEKVRLLSSFVFLIFATFKIIIHMLTDSSLYWILSSVRWDERMLYMSTIREEEPAITVRVVGDGIVAGLIRNVTKAVKRESALTRLDPTPCLPDPVPPDWNRYYQIIALVIICWLLALCEPYGLRLRHTVMVTYHPDRARERAIWLYNRIISSRISFVKLSRRELRKKYKNVTLEETFRYKFMRKTSSSTCLLCNNTINRIDGFVKCTTANCVGFYCNPCFSSLKFCSICKDPAEYGDLSDLSEEKDSSDEEEKLLRSSPKKRGSQKMNKNKDKKKEGLPLNIKKTHIKLKQSPKSPKAECSSFESFTPPNFIFRALQYCRKKIPSFRQLKGLSDVESSDWDPDSTLFTEGSSLEEKLSDFIKTTELNSGEGEKRKSKESVKKSTRRPKSEDFEGDTFKKLMEPEIPIQKVCIYEKVSLPNVNDSAQSFDDSEKLLFVRERSSPEFYSREHTIDEIDPNDVQSESLMKSDSLDAIEKMKKDSQTSKTRDSGALVKEQIEETIELEPETHVYVDPLDLDEKYSEPTTPSPVAFPFIDPMNVHEFIPSEDEFEESPHPEIEQEKLEKQEEEEEENVGKEKKVKPYIVETALTNVPYGFSHARLCLKNTQSSDSKSDTFQVCLLEETIRSSTDSDCQFYSQPYRPSGSLAHQNTKGDIKRASGKLNLNINIRKIGGLYSVETDSSNENFLSVKSPRRFRKKSKKVKSVDEEPDVVLKLLASSPRRKQSRKENFITLSDQKKRKFPTETGSSDRDDVSRDPEPGVFISDEEFPRESKETENLDKKESKQSRKVSWTSDSWSDWPATDRNRVHSRSIFNDSHYYLNFHQSADSPEGLIQ